MDANEFKSVFMPYQPKLYRTAYAILRNAQDAEDIVQEVYMRLWNRRESMDTAICKEAYCVSMVKNMCMDFIRGSHSFSEDEIDDEHLCLTDEDAGMKLDRKEEVNRLKSMISRLPDVQKKVMWLRDVNECSFEEIGAATGLTPVNIRATLSKARKEIREQFNKLYDRV